MRPWSTQSQMKPPCVCVLVRKLRRCFRSEIRVRLCFSAAEKRGDIWFAEKVRISTNPTKMRFCVPTCSAGYFLNASQYLV